MVRCEIESTDRRIDALVYELYGLTADEIRIVEGKDPHPGLTTPLRCGYASQSPKSAIRFGGRRMQYMDEYFIHNPT